jgi:hypothetical protein
MFFPKIKIEKKNSSLHRPVFLPVYTFACSYLMNNGTLPSISGRRDLRQTGYFNMGPMGITAQSSCGLHHH